MKLDIMSSSRVLTGGMTRSRALRNCMTVHFYPQWKCIRFVEAWQASTLMFAGHLVAP